MLEGKAARSSIAVSAAYPLACDLLLIYDLMTKRVASPEKAGSLHEAFGVWKADSGFAARTAAEEVILCMVWRNFTLDDLSTIPMGLALPIRECLRACRGVPNDQWPPEGFELVGREDVSAFVLAPKVCRTGHLTFCLIRPSVAS